MEKKIYLFNALARLTPDNVSEIYNIELNKWRYLNSSEVAINGEAVSDSIEKQLLMLPDEKGEPNIKDCTVNDRDASGFELDEQLFIDEQIAKYKPLLERSKGSTINRGAHLKIKAYIEFLENLAKPKEPALKAKRIVELINDLMQNIDKPPTVCSVIPKKLLSDIYKTFNKKYLGYDSEEEFISCIHNDKPLKYLIEGVVTNFQYLFNMILIKLQDAGFEINKQAVYRKIFNLKKGKNRTTHNGKVKEVDVFLTSFNAKKYT